MKKLLVLIAKPIFFILYLLPQPLRFMLGDFLGILWFDVFRIRRRVILSNLDIAFPDKSYKEKVRLGRWSCQNMGRNFTDVLIFPFLNAKKHLALFRFENLHIYKEALSQGKGVCLMSLHLGSPDMCFVGLALHGLPVNVVSKFFSINLVNDLWFRMRMRFGNKFIAPRNSSYPILKALKRGEAVVFVQDQFMGPPVGVKTVFFGKETGSALGLAVMAHRSKAPVIPFYCYRDKSGVTVTHFDEEIPYEDGPNKEQSRARMTQVYANQVESYVKLHPEQWMWVHRRWKTFQVDTST